MKNLVLEGLIRMKKLKEKILFKLAGFFIVKG